MLFATSQINAHSIYYLSIDAYGFLFLLFIYDFLRLQCNCNKTHPFCSAPRIATKDYAVLFASLKRTYFSFYSHFLNSILSSQY